MKNNPKLREFKIQTKDVKEEYVNNLILSLVRCGYDVYLSSEEEVCFNGWEDEVVGDIKTL